MTESPTPPYGVPHIVYDADGDDITVRLNLFYNDDGTPRPMIEFAEVYSGTTPAVKGTSLSTYLASAREAQKFGQAILDLSRFLDKSTSEESPMTEPISAVLRKPAIPATSTDDIESDISTSILDSYGDPLRIDWVGDEPDMIYLTISDNGETAVAKFTLNQAEVVARLLDNLLFTVKYLADTQEDE